MAEQQLPDINDYINELPVDAAKQDKLYYAFYSDNPRKALESIQDVPKEIRQALFSIRGKIHKGEQYDLNDIVKSAGISKPVVVSAPKPKAPPVAGTPSLTIEQNNNPFALRPTSGESFIGEEKGGNRGFAVFDTPSSSARAATITLQNYQSKYGLDTLRKIFNRYAPKSDNNQPDKYATRVAKDLGVDPDDPIDTKDPDLMKQLLRSIAKVELGSEEKADSYFQDIEDGVGRAFERLAQQKPAPSARKEATTSRVSKPGPYITKLSPSEEQEFIQWAEKNNVPFDLSADADYDMPGFWKALKAKDPRATTEQKPDGLHFPDIWKTPAHETFSSESIYAGPDAPKWKGSKLYDSTGKLIKDESELAKPDKEAEKKTAPPPTAKPVVEKKESIIPGTELTGLPGVPLPSLPGERETRRRIKEEGFFFKSKPKPTEAPRAERKTTVEPTKNKPVEVQKKDTTKTEAIGIPQISTAKPPVEEVYAPSLAKDLFNATVRGIVPGFFNIPRILSRVPGGFREDIEALRTVPSDIQRNEGFIGQEARAKEDALNRKKTAQLIARAEEKVLPEAPVSGVAKFTESTASTAPYIVAGAVGGPYATRAMGAAAGAEEALTRADISGKPLTEGQRVAIGTAGAGIGLTEAIPIDRVIGRLIGAGVVNKALTDADIVKLLFPKLGDRLKSAGVQFGAEALQEGFSGLAQNALESMYGGRPVEEIWTDVGNQFAMGGGAGLVIDILSQLAGTRIGRNRLKRMGIDPQAYKEWVESGEADKAKAEAEEIARKAMAPEEAPAAQPEPPPAVETPAPAVPTAPPATAEQPAPVTAETEIEPVEAPPVIAEPPTTATATPPVVTATAEPPAVEAKPTEGVTTAEVKDLEVTDPFSGSSTTVQVPSSVAAKYETLTDLQKEAAAGNFLALASTPLEDISSEIRSIKNDLKELDKNPAAAAGLDPYFPSPEDFKSFTNEIIIPYLEHLKASSPSTGLTTEPAPTEPTATAPPPVATPTTPEPPTAPVPAAQPAPATTAAQVAHPKLNDQGQPVIINSPSEPTPDTTWTDPATTAVFVPEGNTPTKIGNTELKPWTPPQDGWSSISGVNEKLDNRKPFTSTPGKQAASGVIIVEDDGRVWLISPTNQFGGYDNTLPKGKLDPSLSMQENAIKEAWEETGLKVDIIGIVGDYEKSTSKVRYYLAKRVGGTPKNMGWEAQAVKLATLDDAKNLLNQQVDKDIISDLEKMVSSGKLAEIKDGTPRKLSTYGREVSTKIGGSNPGGWYQDGGTKWLVKGNKQKVIGSVTPEQSDARAANEVLASKLIRAVMKISAPEMKLVDLEGKYGGGLGVASKKVPSFESFNPDNPGHVNAAAKTFAINAWLANYDVLGMGYDNTVITPNGNAINIDPGGALLFRAQGLPKGASHGVVNGLLDPSAPEFESMQKTTPEQKAVFGKMTPEQLKDSAKPLATISDETIKKLVNTYGWGSDADKAALADNLIQRKNAILQKAGVTTTSSVAPVAQPSPQVTPQPPSPAVATQTQQPPVAATAKLQLGDPTFGMKLDASPATVAEYESLSDSDKDNAYNLISGYIGYFEDPAYILNQYPNILSFVQASINTTSNAQVPYSKAVKLYLEDVANQLAGKTDSEQIEIVKQIVDQSSGWTQEPPQTSPTAPSWSTPSLPSSAALAGAYQPWKDDAPQDVLDKWNSATPDQQAEASIGIHNIVKPVAEIIASGGSPEEVLQFTIDSYENDPWSQQGVKDIIVPYLKHLKSEVVGKSSNEALDYINKVGEDWGLANNWIESVPGYQSYVASQSGQTAPPPSPAVATQAPPSLTQQAAPAAVQPPQLAAAQPAQQVPQVKIKYKGGSIDAPQNVAAKFSMLNSYWKKKVAQYVSDAATALGGFASQNSSPTEVINYLDNMISIFQSAASSPTSVVAQTANSSVLVPLFEDIKSKFSATTSLITPGSPAAADVSLIYLPFKGLLDNFATPAVTPQQSSQPNTVVSQTAQAPPAGTDQVSTSYGDFIIPSNFVTIFNSMTPGNKESFGKHILEPLFSSITSGASASDIHAKVQSKLTEAQGKLSGYQQKIANGTAVQTEKDRADYYQNLVIPYLNFVSSTGQVPSQPPPTYTSPSGATLSLTPGTLPPKPTWATQLFAQSILSQSPNIISNLANQLSYYGFVNAIKGEANSETQAELNKAQSLVSQSSVDASLIEKAKADGLAKYATIALSYKDVPAKWTRRLFEYIDKPDKFKFAFNPSSYLSSAQSNKSDAQLKSSFDLHQENEIQSKLTSTQIGYLKNYGGGGYSGLNGSIATSYKSGSPLPYDIAKMVNGDAGSPGIDDAMNKITLGHDMLLKRAVSSVNFWSQFGFTSSNQPMDPATMKAMIGQTYTEISYAGASTDPKWDSTVASSLKGKVIFTISANKDVHGIKIYGNPVYGMGSEGPGYENEILLHRGTTYVIKSFKFRGYEYDQGDNKPIWEAEMMVVDQSPKPLP
jgi:ADP-ribose pyrophosphatase YjhB (NUDIX family)